MTDKISEAAKRLACQLVNQIDDTTFGPDECEWAPLKALARVLQQHSDVVEPVVSWMGYVSPKNLHISALQSLILPDDPDPVEAAWDEFWYMPKDVRTAPLENLKVILAKHGLRITRKD